jgi:hypothetical protein
MLPLADQLPTVPVNQRLQLLAGWFDAGVVWFHTVHYDRAVGIIDASTTYR